jgi:hypothetical protein
LFGKAISDSKNGMFGEINELKNYRKYESISFEKKQELLNLIRIGINPENVQTEEEKKKVQA